MMEDEAGEAAQTGNLVHSAAAEYHRTGNIEEALKALDADRAKFPDGDPKKAIKIFTNYSADPRNQGVTCLAVEKHVELVLAPAPDDPSGLPIHIEGTLDQVRVRNEKNILADIKTGYRLNAQETVAEYLVQQACYWLAAEQTLGITIHEAELIHTPAYEKNRGNPFLPTKLTKNSVLVLLSGVVSLVSLIRKGHPIFRPGDPCDYCPLKNYDNCYHFARGIL
jgi:hypothetical protein